MTLNGVFDWAKSRYGLRINNITTGFFIQILKESTTHRKIGIYMSIF